MSWQAPQGAITCILGPNGAGKTSIMEMAEGLRRPESGTVRVLGNDPWHADADHRRRVGVMLQDGGLPGSVKPLRLLHHLASLYDETGELSSLVDELGIEEFRHTSLRRLSGGQRQRVALAAALVGQPDVVFLDEPSAGLDPHARLDVWDLVRRTRDRGCCVVVTTHSFEEAERLADRVIIVAAGTVATAGSVTEVSGTASLEDTYFSLTRIPGKTMR
ncbi:ABC transporter ATP-binding protein [Flexivirga caeni]|uniref:ABC transporter ATP-binding protein n=2 Tax=Flexivirga caeni TaxID=2294115 RepID=A0A3M9MI96_9MICO|nr:ABC transporter ATP-binding protein [Flexivirga caeni]RNI24925.1 ABC transporter ATP-binding protein [Flexivirga caeni]